jgi:hypothetical protein
MAEDKKETGRSITTAPFTTSANTNVVKLSDNGVRAGDLVDKALGTLSQEQLSALGLEAGKEIIRMKVKAQEQGMDYVAGKKAIEDHIETFDALDKRGRTTRQTVESQVNTGAGRMNITSKSGASCFVATAAYGDPDHPDVRFLRSFRDGFLAHHQVGRAFIDWYWRVGPRMARVVGPRPFLRLASRVGLRMLIQGVRLTWRRGV